MSPVSCALICIRTQLDACQATTLMAKSHLGANYPNLGVGTLAIDRSLENRYEAGTITPTRVQGKHMGAGENRDTASLPPCQLWITPARYKYKPRVHRG